MVLVADDDAVVASLVRAVLGRGGFDVVTAANGSDALEMALERHPAACVLDIMMPDLNGYEVVRRMKDDPATAGIPIVLLSSRAGALDREFGLRIGADAYINKPVPPNELRDTLWRLLEPDREPGA
ncbi:MAG: hypothetical protein QOF37_856 [Thermoleophilaceae bacterium]|nr:hypothetical protein [Thermoleophilaceae bacterium]